MEADSGRQEKGTYLEALGSSALEEVVDGTNNDDALSVRVDLETADLDTVLEGDVLIGSMRSVEAAPAQGHGRGDRKRNKGTHLDLRDLHVGLNELLVVKLVIESLDLLSGQGLGEGDVDRRHDTLEPRGNVRDESELEGSRRHTAEVVRCLALVDVVRKRVGTDSTGQVLGTDLGLSHRSSAPARLAAGLCSSSTVTRHAKHSGRV